MDVQRAKDGKLGVMHNPTVDRTTNGIGRFLKEADLTKRYERHSHLPESTNQKANVPHETQEMDARRYGKALHVKIIRFCANSTMSIGMTTY